MYFIKNETGEFVEVSEKLVPEAQVQGQIQELKTKVNEFRTTNANLLKTNESLSAFAQVLDGAANITPEVLNQKIDAKAVQRAEALVGEMKTKHTETVQTLTEQLNTSQSQLFKLVLGSEVQKAGAKHGVVATAYDDVVRRAEADFEVKEGKVVFKQAKLDGDGKPYSVDAWMADQAKAAPHLFAPSQGPAARRNTTVRTTNAVPHGVDRIEAALQQKK